MIFTHSSSPGRDDLLGAVDVVRRHLRDVHEALDAFADLDERTELDELGDPAVDELLDLVALGELLPRILLGGLQRQADALAAVVDVEHLHLDRIADGDDRARVVDVLPRQLADVDEAVHAAEVDERAEADDRGDRSVADFAHLEVVEELVAGLLLVLLQVGATRQDHVVAVLVEFDDLAVHGLADVGARSRTRRSSTSDAGRKPRRPMSTMRPPLTTSMTGPDTTASASFLASMSPQARSYCARFFDSSRRPSLSSLVSTRASTRLTERDDLGRVDVVADAQLTSEDHALGLVADVEQHLVLVDLDHGAVDELAVLDGDHGAVDRIGERHAEVVGDDLAGGVRALFVEGSHRVGGRLGGGCGVGQGTNCFRNGSGENGRCGWTASTLRDAADHGTSASPPETTRPRAQHPTIRASLRSAHASLNFGVERWATTRNSGDSVVGGSDP